MRILLRLLPAACVLALMLPVPAEADKEEDWCEYFPTGSSSCAANRHVQYYGNGSGPAAICPFGAVCVKTFNPDLTPAVGPNPAMLDCWQASPQGNWCESWPKGEFSYTWAASSALTLGPIHGDGSAREVLCNWPAGSHLVSVTVTAPNGLAETAHAQVYCNGVIP